jgi:hypothetical protein
VSIVLNKKVGTCPLPRLRSSLQSALKKIASERATGFEPATFSLGS